MSKIKLQGNASGTGTTTFQSANTSSNTTFTLPGTDGTNGQVLTTDGAGALTFTTVSGGGGTTTNALTMNSGGAGDASGTTFNGSAARTISYNTIGAAATGAANTFTAAQTFRAASAIRSEAASTQDAIVVAGRAGGTSSYAVTLTPTTLSANRTVTIPDETFTVGYIGAPQSTNTTVAASDAGKHIYFTGGSTATLTVNTNATTAIDVGTVILVVNNNSGNLTISGAGVTFQLANGSTGNRTVATKGMATMLKVATDTWYVSGAGVT
jgi:hypothetical protein